LDNVNSEDVEANLVQVWLVEGGLGLVETFECSGEVDAIAFLRDGIGAASQEQLTIWDIISGQKVAQFGVPGKGLAFSPDGSMLFTEHEKKIVAYRVADGEPAYTLEDPADGVWHLAVSRDNKVLAASFSGRNQLWRLP
jgi:hypothetical protein